jgi:hypothetical protein
MHPSMDASTATESNDCLKDDDNLLEELMEALEADDTLEAPAAAPEKKKDHVMVYHDMIRRAMVDWGDDIIDVLVAKFSKYPKIVTHIQAVRKDMIDPLRVHVE